MTRFEKQSNAELSGLGADTLSEERPPLHTAALPKTPETGAIQRRAGGRGTGPYHLVPRSLQIRSEPMARAVAANSKTPDKSVPPPPFPRNARSTARGPFPRTTCAGARAAVNARKATAAQAASHCQCRDAATPHADDGRPARPAARHRPGDGAHEGRPIHPAGRRGVR